MDQVLGGVMMFHSAEFNIFYQDKVKFSFLSFPPYTVSFAFRRNPLFHIVDFL